MRKDVCSSERRIRGGDRGHNPRLAPFCQQEPGVKYGKGWMTDSGIGRNHQTGSEWKRRFPENFYSGAIRFYNRLSPEGSLLSFQCHHRRRREDLAKDLRNLAAFKNHEGSVSRWRDETRRARLQANQDDLIWDENE